MNVLGAFGSAKKVLLSQVCIYTEKKEKKFSPAYISSNWVTLKKRQKKKKMATNAARKTMKKILDKKVFCALDF